MSLAPKIDEVRQSIQNANLDLALITETWLRSHIHDNVISISGYNIVRRDRLLDTHSGVCIYVKNSIDFQVLNFIMNDKIEAIWLKLRPSRLPMGIPCIIIANVYHPRTNKGAKDSYLLSYFYDSMSAIESRFPNCCVLIAGDFNRLDMSRFCNAFQLKQIVKFPSRGDRTLDVIFTNLKEYHENPVKRPAFGLSDHATIEI